MKITAKICDLTVCKTHLCSGQEAPAADGNIKGVFFGWDVNLTT